MSGSTIHTKLFSSPTHSSVVRKSTKSLKESLIPQRPVEKGRFVTAKNTNSYPLEISTAKSRPISAPPSTTPGRRSVSFFSEGGEERPPTFMKPTLSTSRKEKPLPEPKNEPAPFIALLRPKEVSGVGPISLTV